MEQSAFEAVMIGVNVFIFIAALSAGIMLMSSITDLVEYANKPAIVGVNGTIAETVGIVNERIYTGSQLLNYYRNEIEIQETAREDAKEIFYVKLSEDGQERLLQSFVESQAVSQYLTKEFVLQYKGVSEDKHVYVFSLIY